MYFKENTTRLSLVAMSMKMTALWDIAPCSLNDVD
jgi:hypothetical protein